MKKIIINLLRVLNIKIETKNERFLNSLFDKYKDYTMIPREIFIDNIILCQDFFPGEGAIVECGVWRGGMIAGISDSLKKFNNVYYLYDSFEGLPEVKEIDGRGAKDWQNDNSGPYYFDNCCAEQEIAEGVFKDLGVNYKIIKGWFNETIPLNSPAETISILRLDADWYDSTLVCLENLYPLIRQFGLIIIDDYYTWEGCSKAVHDYLSKIKSSSKIQETSLGTAFIIKNETNEIRV